MTATNEFGQPVGDAVPGWDGAAPPEATTLPGAYCTLERFDPDRHVDALYAAFAAAPDARDWTYLPVGPFPTAQSYREWATAAAASDDPRHYAVVDNATGRAVGTLALMRHDPRNGVIEVGFVTFSRAVQRTPMSTEAQFLAMRYAFELGYRRYEWKCDSLNEPSRRAAERLGFTYEGTFRQAVVYKNRNRDTAWYAIVDSDWPTIRDAFEKWLAPDNFDTDGQQRAALRTRGQRAAVRLRATVVRWHSDDFPGWVELSVRDARGRVHRIIEKAAAATSPSVTAHAAFPLESWLDAETQSVDGDVVVVRLAHGVETVDGARELTMSAADVV